MALIDVPQMKPLVHVSGMFGAWRGNTSWVAPLAWHPENRNAVILVDLAGDISPLLELDSDTLRERLYTAKADLGDNAAVPVKLVHINKCPVLAQANTLRPEDADRLGINRQHCLDNLKILRENPQVREKVVAIFAEAEPFTPSDNVDAQLYNGFFSDADRAAMKIVLETEPRIYRHWISLLLINELKNCVQLSSAQLPGDTGLCRAATLAGAPPPGLHARVFAGLC